MAIGQNNEIRSISAKCSSALFSEGQLNFTVLKFEYWNGLLGFRISPCISDSTGKLKVDNDNNISLFLTPQKARIFLASIEAMLENPTKFTNAGINSNNGLITFSHGEDYGLSNSPLISIRKISESGQITSSLTYEFKQDSCEAIVNFDDSNPSKERYNLGTNIEIELVLDVLRTFIEASTSAQAYWNNYTFEYYNQKNYELMTQMADKLGISRGGYKRPNKSYFTEDNNNDNNQSHQNVNSSDVSEYF